MSQNTIQTRNEANGAIQYRELRLSRAAVGSDRRITFPCSSEAPVLQWNWRIGDYLEILDHSPESVRLEKLNDGAPFLKDHRTDQQIGVVEQADLVDRRIVTTNRFGNSALALEEEKDVSDEVRTKVSVGYIVHILRLEEEREDGPDVYRAIDWEPLETSTVAIPADFSVGVGRSEANVAYPRFDTQVIGRESRPGGNVMDDIWVVRLEDGVLLRIKENEFDSKKHERSSAPAAMVPAQSQESQPSGGARTGVSELATPSAEEVAHRSAGEAVVAERERIAEIMKIGSRFNQSDLAQEAIRENVPAAIFRNHVWGQQPEGKPLDEPISHLGMSDGDARGFSLMRAINAFANHRPEDAPFEMECSRAVSEKTGEEPRGFYVPSDALYVEDPSLARAQQMRDLEVGVAADGGDLVATQLRPGNFIDVLRNSALSTQLGARMLPGLVGDIDLPRQATGSVAGWIAEKANAPKSELTVDLVSMTPKTLAVESLMTRKLRKQSTPAIEGLVRSDLAMAIALGVDLAAFTGAGGTDVPEGILNTTGVGSIELGANGGAPSWVDMVNLVKTVRAANAHVGSLGFAANANVWGTLMSTQRAAGTERFILEDPGEKLLGRRFGVSEQIPSDLDKGASVGVLSALIYGNWSDLLIGEWGTMDVAPDPYTEGGQGALIIRVFKDVDTAVRHPESFAAITDMVTD